MKIYDIYPEIYPLWRSALVKEDTVEREVKFILDCIKSSDKPIRSIIDMGGGAGLHADLLQKEGYDVTIFDSSQKALDIAIKRNSKLTIKKGSFENIDLKEKYDACICMWTTFPYITNKEASKHFFIWISAHINNLVLLDEGNFYNYPKLLDEIYSAKNNKYEIKIHRKWNMDKNFFRKTVFENEIFNVKTKKVEIVKDNEFMQFLSVEEIEKLIGSKWKTVNLFGDYNIKSKYEKNKSARLILLSIRNEVKRYD